MVQQFKIALIREGATRMTCREARCKDYEHGWITVINEGSEQGQRQAHYIRTESGRRYVEFPSEDAGEHLAGEELSLAPGLTVFKFYAGQECFAGHADREVLFVHKQGGHSRVHINPRDFNEHFNEAAEQAAEAARRG